MSQLNESNPQGRAAPTSADSTLSSAQDHTTQPPNEALRADPTRFGQAYSERNPATNIAAFHESEQRRHEASDRYLENQKPTAQDSKNTNVPDDTPKADQTDDVPIGAENPEVNLDQVFQDISKSLRPVSYAVFGAIIVLDWLFIGGGLRGFLKSFFPAGGVAVAVYFILTRVGQNAAGRKVERTEAKTEKLRYVPESVEWMNTLVETLWDTLQQDFFDNIASQINDTIKPYIPKSVPATVKITELGHGSQSLRVLSMRSLPDSEFGHLVPAHGLDKSGSAAQAKEKEKAIEREEGGVFYNLEIAVAYHEPPFRSRKDHMHVDVLAMLGPVPFPVFVQVKEFVATIRIRLQMHPDLPFLKNITFALTEKPKVNACVSLGAPWALDLLNLPVIDSVLNSQIDAAAADFVQPKSMSLDMTAYVGGSDQKEETEAIGVLIVKIHRARNLARQDSRGPGADPYLTIAFSKYEKPMYATRIIKGDRNPVWEESAIIMIRAEHVKRQENVLLRLWDSDTTGSDDVSGVCEFPLQELILNANKMHRREDQLQGDTSGTDAEGILEWEIGYYPRAEFEKHLRTTATDPRDHHGNKIEATEEQKQEQNAQNTVPDPNLPAGILGITIHQCINVDIDNPNKKSMGYVKVRGQDSDGEDDDEEETISIDYIPSLYVSLDINDQLKYRTRVKSITNQPTFNSSHETYIRDWRMATLTLSVWDARKKTDDSLVGVVALKLSDIFHESSSVVKFCDLKGGQGSGRIRISMIFRSIGMKLDKSLLGYEIGSFVFSSPIACIGKFNTRKLTLRTAGSTRTIKGGEKAEGGHTWLLDDKQSVLPVHHRYMSPLVLEFAGITEKVPGPLGKMMNKNKNFAVLWLYELNDNEEQTFTLPIYKTDNPDRLTQNVVSQPDDTMALEQVGEVSFQGRFSAGLDASHEEFLGESHDRWSAYQSWAAAKKSGQRDFQVERTTNKTVQALMAKSGKVGA
ncbi:C2 domain protein [Venturia nashicola]|nr:C2 domain protein [Venturia nashicola]